MSTGSFNPYTTPGSSTLSPTIGARVDAAARPRGERFLQATRTAAAVPSASCSSSSSSSPSSFPSSSPSPHCDAEDEQKMVDDVIVSRGRRSDRGRGGEGGGRGRGRGVGQSVSTRSAAAAATAVSFTSASMTEGKTLHAYLNPAGKWRGALMTPAGSITVVKAASPSNDLTPSAADSSPLLPASADLTPEAAPALSSVSPLPYSDSFDSSDSSPSPPLLVTPFDPTPSQLRLISLINGWNSTHFDSSHLTLEQQSVLRHRVMHNDDEAMSLLSSSSSSSSPSFIALQLFVARVVQQERECRLLQHAELDVLRAIFQSELHISPTLPLTLRVIVRLDEVDCELELAFLLPPLYPLRDAVAVNFFVPPPFSDLFPSHDLSLHDVLNDQAKHMIGEEGGAVYGVVEMARQWMEGQLGRLKRSVEKAVEQKSEREVGYVRQLLSAVLDGAKAAVADEESHRGQQAVGLFGRGRVEELMNQAIQSTSREKGVSREKAKAMLKENGWNVTEVGCATTASGDDDEYVEGVRASFVDQFVSDSELTCLSCCDTFQWREGAMMRCHHFLCYPCYARYLLSHQNDGSAFIRDPGHRCVEYVSEELLFSLLSPADYRRYRRIVQDNFITVSGWRWCPNPQCSFVASSSEPHGLVQCHCGTCYCVGCGKAGHWPLPCGAAGAYFGSVVIADLRCQYNLLVKLEPQKEDEGALTIRTKPCPKCKTQYERSEGCNHMKCVKCGAHYCFICLGDWAIHGVEWFKCPFSEREVQFRKMTFHAGVAISDLDMDVIRSMVGKEVNHAMRVASIRRALADKHTLSSLAHALPNTTVVFITALLSTLLQAHIILQHTYILLCVYKHQVAPHRLTAHTRQLLHSLSQVEYFVAALDRSLVVEPEAEAEAEAEAWDARVRVERVRQVRQVRTAYQLEDTVRVVMKRMKDLACQLTHFSHTQVAAAEARMEQTGEQQDEDGLTDGAAATATEGAPKKRGEKRAPMDAASFFGTLDRKSGQLGKKTSPSDLMLPFDQL